MTTTDEKENIMSLPLQERAVAVALKHLFDEIKQLEDEENQEVQNIHHSFIGRFKEVENNASQVIRGDPIPEILLQNTEKYFEQSERAQVKDLAKNNKGVDAYWLTTLLSFYKDELTLPDKEIATAITEISTNVTKDTLELKFTIAQNEWLAATTITRRFVLEDGAATKTEGDHAKWLKSRPEGIFSIILSEAKTPEELTTAFSFASEFINEIVPYSLEYFLGITEGEEDLQEAEEEEDEDQQEQEDEVPAKKIKE